MRVIVYLKTPLFSIEHVPAGAWVLEATLAETANGLLDLEVDGYQNGDGKSLEGAATKLLVPVAKVDHLQKV